MDDYEFTREHSEGIDKIGLPRPATVVDSVADEYYKGDLEEMAMDCPPRGESPACSGVSSYTIR